MSLGCMRCGLLPGFYLICLLLLLSIYLLPVPMVKFGRFSTDAVHCCINKNLALPSGRALLEARPSQEARLALLVCRARPP